MTKPILIIVFSCNALSALSQDVHESMRRPDRRYQSFRWALGIGYGFPDGFTTNGGGCAYQEPSYRLTDDIAIGLRMEWALMNHRQDVPNSSFKVRNYLISRTSFTINGQIYWRKTSGKFRPFSGGGLGLYTMATNLDENGRTYTMENVAKNRFGWYPRIGFDYRAFTMNLEWNRIPKATIITQASGNHLAVQTSYLAVKTGFFVGGKLK